MGSHSADDETLDCGRRCAKYFGDAAGYLCSDPISTYYIFTTYDSISTWYNIDNTNVA